jgi:hypothetical protein
MTPGSIRPGRDEAADYYFTYIDQVPEGDICATLDTQGAALTRILGGVSDGRSRHAYAPGKWTIAEVAAHINDCERTFAFRAFWFARGFESPLPSFDQGIATAQADAHARPWPSHIEEFDHLRAATLDLFRRLPSAAWTRRGVASDHPVTVRALAYIVAGHVAHHQRILEERYGVTP